MKTKKCYKCGEYKPLTEYSKDKTKKDGFQSKCKLCVKKYYQENKEQILEQKKQYRQENKEQISERSKQYYQENKERIAEYYQENKESILEWQKQYYQENKERIAEYDKQYYQENRKHKLEQKKQYYQENKERIAEYKKQYYQENKERVSENNKQYYQENKERIAEYERERYNNDPLFRLNKNIRSRIGDSIRNNGYTKKSRTYEILGCSYEDFKQHIESQFEPWMTWDNYGEWELDHNIPVSSHGDEDELIKLNHYTNLQPMRAEDNRKKGDSYLEEDKQRYLEQLSRTLKIKQ